MCCERAKTAMEVIKSQVDHDLTRGELLMLFQKMIEDSEKMGNRMTNIEKKFESLENRVDTGFATITQQLIDLKKVVEQRKQTFWDKIPLLKDLPTFFWLTIIFFIGCVFAWLGANMSWVQNVFKFGGQ